jgi:hypothetical protein
LRQHDMTTYINVVPVSMAAWPPVLAMSPELPAVYIRW